MTPPRSDRDQSIRVVAAGEESRPLVVVLHGWGSNSGLMRGFVDRLSDAFRVLNVDLPGHGQAPAPAAPMGMEEHAAALASLIRDQDQGPAHVIGHSNGGRIALWMAGSETHCHLIASLTLISPSGVRRPRRTGYYVRKWTAKILKAPFSVLPRPFREAGLDWLRHSLVWRLLGSSDYRALRGTMRETFVRLVNTYVEDRLPLITAPTLVFWGTKDDAVLRPQIDILVNGISDAGLVPLNGAGHYGFLDAPETVLEGTRSFLDQIGQTGPEVAR
ncbi:MAG: pimeloyl-ACP methyl ester carboxylesterase [Rhodothermales bacterium]|jgi:pimeloyl-ACP methyl ester carboxylesterase